MPKDVPKIIWQTHNYLYEDLPEHLKQVTQTWINLNPTWEYRYVNHVDRAEFVKTEDPVLYTHYEKLAPITQGDIWRYLVTYKYGGAYADMDSVCTVPLDYMLETLQCEHDLLATSQSGMPPLDYNNCNYVVGKNSKNLEIIIKSMKDEYYLTDKLNKWACPLTRFCVQASISDTACKDFYGALHSEGFKSAFDDTFEVNYYGKHIAYKQLIRDLPR
jgi:mannosyltransferase OCH1-like enzyme